MEQLTPYLTDFHEIWYLSIFQKSTKKIWVSLKSAKNDGHFTWKPMYIFDHISLIFFLEWGMFQTEVVEKIESRHCMLNNFFFLILPLWGNMEKYCRARQATDDNIISRMRVACWIPKSKNTHSEYVILIAFPLWQWLHQRTSVSRCTYIACLMKRLWWWHIAFIFDFLEFVLIWCYEENMEIWLVSVFDWNWPSKVDASLPFCWGVQMKCVQNTKQWLKSPETR